MSIELPLANGGVVLVDEADLPLISQYRWTRVGHYAIASNFKVDGKPKMQSMHRLLLGAAKGQWCDHANGNGLDNRRANIRLCTPSQNAMNRPTRGEFRGVAKVGETYSMLIYADNCCYRREGFATAIEAARAFDSACAVLHGEFGRPNFPNEKPAPLTGPLACTRGKQPHPAVAHLVVPSHGDLWELKNKIRAAEREVERAKAELECAEADIANARVFPQLPKRHADMLRLRVNGLTLQEVGARFGVTRERVRQIEVRARSLGFRLPGAPDISDAARTRYGWHAPLKRGRPRKSVVLSEAA